MLGKARPSKIIRVPVNVRKLRNCKRKHFYGLVGGFSFRHCSVHEAFYFKRAIKTLDALLF